MSKFTPGPWVMHHDEYCPEEIFGDLDGESEGTLVCNVAGDMDLPENFANARLIAAAPDLLAALKELIEVGNYCCESIDHEAASLRFGKAVASARTAIAKAGG